MPTLDPTAAVAPRARRPGARNSVEFLVGLLVLVGLAGLLLLAVVGNGRRSEEGYRLTAQFSHIDGLSVGSDVRLAGVSIGQVVAETVDPRSYQAKVTFTVREGIQLPTDSSAVVTSDSLLGGKYLALDPGGAESILKPGSRVSLTQGSISLEQLLSKFIFSVTDAMSAQKPKAADAAVPPGAPAPPAPAASATPQP